MLCILIVISMFGVTFQPGILIMIMLYMIFGLGKGLTDTTTSSLIADLHTGRESAIKMGILHGVFGIGGLVTPLFISQMKLKGLMWNEVYLVFAYIAIGCLICYLLVFIKTNNILKPRFESEKVITIKLVLSYLRVKQNYLLMGAIFSYAVFQIGYYLWIIRYVETFLGSPSMGAAALALFWIGTAVARILLPRLKFPITDIIIWGNIISLVFCLIGIWSMSALIVAVCSLIAGLSSGAAISLLLYMSYSWSNKNTLVATTVLYFVFYIGQAICPPAVGAIMDFASMPWGLTVATCFVLISALFVLPLRKEKGVL